MRCSTRGTATASSVGASTADSREHRARHDVLLGEVPDRPEAEQPVEDDQRHLDQRAGRRDRPQLPLSAFATRA